MIDFRITGLPAERFAHLYYLTEADLAAKGVQRLVVDQKPGFPDRIELRDLEIGEKALLLNFVHQEAGTPYRASHAIFVGEGALQRYDRVNEVPEVLRLRELSLRAFDGAGSMLDADLVDGRQVEATIDRLLADPRVAYVQAHYAKRGCYAARIERAR